jgi:hypothetical protein
MKEKYFKNNQYVKGQVFSRKGDFLDPNKIFMERRFQFLHGSQEKISEEKENKNIVVYSEPASPFDWIKSLIINFEPTLAFGWLVPKMLRFEVPQTIVNIEKYINVIPTPEQYEGHDAVALRYFGIERLELDSFIFLESMPVTRADIQKVEIELLDIQQSAFYFARKPSGL